jgi:hypothetical protein
VAWIVSDPTISNSVQSRADDIAAQFCASVIGIVYYWLSNPEDLVFVKSLHEGLNKTMNQLLSGH